MRHLKIPKSNRHKKLKSVNGSNDDCFIETNVNQKNIKEQTIPRKWKQIMDLKKELTQKKSKKKRNKNNHLLCVKSESEAIEKGMTRSHKPLPEKLEQGLYESETHFLQRLTKLSAKARAEANIEDRFDVDFCQKLDSKEDQMNDKLKISDNQKDSDKISNKKLKRKQKEAKKKEKKHKNKKTDDVFGHLKDVVAFGETVNEPPILSHFKLKNKSKNNFSDSVKL